MYAQKDYTDIQGNNGSNTIAESGALLTAFANLLTRFGHGVNPSMLNAVFIEDGVYLHEDEEVRDKLAYTSVSAYDSTVGPSGIGEGVPTTHNAIIRMEYFSKLLDKDVSTYALVADNVAGTIIDSYDGVTKSWDVYGGPKEYVEYRRYDAIAVEPLVAPVAPEVPETPEVAPAPVEETKTYDVPDDTAGWHLHEAALAKAATDINVVKGTYYIRTVDAENGIVLITTTPDAESGAWIEATLPDEGEKIPVRVVKTDPNEWKNTYFDNPGDVIVGFIATSDITIINYDDPTDTKLVPQGAVVPVAGYFLKDHVSYARTKKSVDDGTWYGVPVTELEIDEAEFDKNLQDIYTNEDGDDIDLGIDDDASAKDKVIKAAATAEGKIQKVTSFLKRK